MEKVDVPLQVAQHVLWHFGDTNLGVQPGGFWTQLFRAWDHADAENRERARAGWPVEAAAFFSVKFDLDGMERLRSLVKRSVFPVPVLSERERLVAQIREVLDVLELAWSRGIRPAYEPLDDLVADLRSLDVVAVEL